MSIKLLAMGNVLMGDDGIAVYVAADLEERLNKLAVEVIYGETDIGYSIAQIDKEDFIIVMDAAGLGKTAGEVTMLSLQDYSAKKADLSLHNISFLDLLKLYYPENDGIIIAIEIEEVRFCYGLGKKMADILNMISQEIWERINKVLYHLETSL